MGWTESGDTLIELVGKLKFKTSEEAARFAKDKGWAYTIVPPKARIVTPRNYLDNFKYTAPEARTNPQTGGKAN